MKAGITSQTAKQQNGMTLIELLLVTAIFGVLMSLAIPSYQRYRDTVDNALAITDIKLIESTITRFIVANTSLPSDLSSIGMAGLADPWGNPYQYLRFDAATKVGKMRKDKSLVPVNSDYDLYSMGKGGTSATPFTSKPGRDDIVRANNGRFIGLAEEY